ncbi:MAG: hypothetical protein ACI30M_04190 [Muribaculaceae bacterium]
MTRRRRCAPRLVLSITASSPSLPDDEFDATTEPLRGSMIGYSGHYPHTECLRHFSVGFTTNRHLRSRTPKCLRHIGVHRLVTITW